MNSLFSKAIHPDDISKIIDFKGGIEKNTQLHAIQSHGVAALYNILTKQDFAFLADEVGMGKTYQALGLIAFMLNLKKDLNIVVVSPRKNLQEKWINDYNNFVRLNYKRDYDGDDIMRTIITKQPIYNPCLCDNLKEFYCSLLSVQKQIYFLRHSSFRMPIIVKKEDERAFVRKWNEERLKLKDIGIYLPQKGYVDFNKSIPPSEQMNLWFAESLRKIILSNKFDDQRPIDLLIFDECQYLRNSNNQTNKVFRSVFKNSVKKWLFLSATPIHSGIFDVYNIIKYYIGENVDISIFQHERKYQNYLKNFTIRRSREYKLSDDTSLKKSKYRNQVKDEIKLHDIKPLQYLVLCGVQKYLVQALDNKNNRFKIGCLSSFESLRSSLITAEEKKKDLKNESDDESHDIYQSANNDKTERIDKKDILDFDYINRLSEGFEHKFGRPLPHPKIDKVADDIFEKVKSLNCKFLIFNRRIKAVEELVNSFNEKYIRDIIERLDRVWKNKLNLEYINEPLDSIDEDDTPELMGKSFEGVKILREISAKGNWLYNYRLRYKDPGSNAFMFEENWFRVLAEIKNISLDDVFKKIPDTLWLESYNYALRFYANRPRLYRVDRYKYLIVNLVDKHPQILNLTEEEKNQWVIFLKTRFVLDRVPSSKKSYKIEKDPDLILFVSFWDHLRLNITDSNYSNFSALFDINYFKTHFPDALFKREILKSAIWQFIRLSDHLIDFYFAEKKNGERNLLNTYFNDYFLTQDKSAVNLRSDITNWINHFDLIFNNCFSKKEKIEELSRKYSFTEFNEPAYAIGITGGSRIATTALKQFKSPTYPKILVCTDVLKEGEDLHLFCDNVVHYGLAWTSGDSEQRVGRVDRYFSQIERKLSLANKDSYPQLNVLFPYIGNSIEKFQVDRVMDRIKIAESILDFSIINKSKEDKELSVSYFNNVPAIQNECIVVKESPFLTSIHIPTISKINFDCQADLLNNKIQKTKILKLKQFFEKEFTIEILENDFAMRLYYNGTNTKLSWKFINVLNTYCIQVIRSVKQDQLNQAYPIKTFVASEGYNRFYYKSHNVFYTSKCDEYLIFERIKNSLFFLDNPDSLGKRVITSQDLLSNLKKKIKARNVAFLKEHKAEIVIDFKYRKQNCTIYTFENLFIISSKVCEISKINSSGLINGSDVTQWILNENLQLDLGYLTVKNEHLVLAERVFSKGLSLDFITDLIVKIVHKADMLELQLTGTDEE